MPPKKKSSRDENEFRGDKNETEKEENELDKELRERWGETKKEQVIRKETNERNRTMATINPSEWNLDDAEEPVVLPAGTEAKVRIISVRIGRTAIEKGSMQYIQPTVEICDEPMAKDFGIYLGLPEPTKMTPKALQRTKWTLKCFYECFKISTSGESNPQEDWLGLEGWVVLGVQENPGYGQQNNVAEYIKPK